MTPPPLLEPATVACLAAACRGRDRPREGSIKASFALAILKNVRDGRSPAPSEPDAVRDFLGGVGLIVRRGKSDAITSAGLRLLDNASARP